MGARQSRRSVDITTTPKKEGLPADGGVGDAAAPGDGKLERIEEADTKPTTNGIAPHTDVPEDKDKDKDDATEKEKDKEQQEEVKETKQESGGESPAETAEVTTPTEASTPNTATSPDNKETKKKEKMKKKWSFRSISFSKKDKNKPAREEAPKNGDVTKEEPLAEGGEEQENGSGSPVEEKSAVSSPTTENEEAAAVAAASSPASSPQPASSVAEAKEESSGAASAASSPAEEKTEESADPTPAPVEEKKEEVEKLLEAEKKAVEVSPAVGGQSDPVLEASVFRAQTVATPSIIERKTSEDIPSLPPSSPPPTPIDSSPLQQAQQAAATATALAEALKLPAEAARCSQHFAPPPLLQPISPLQPRPTLLRYRWWLDPEDGGRSMDNNAIVSEIISEIVEESVARRESASASASSRPANTREEEIRESIEEMIAPNEAAREEERATVVDPPVATIDAIVESEEGPVDSFDYYPLPPEQLSSPPSSTLLAAPETRNEEHTRVPTAERISTETTTPLPPPSTLPGSPPSPPTSNASITSGLTPFTVDSSQSLLYDDQSNREFKMESVSISLNSYNESDIELKERLAESLAETEKQEESLVSCQLLNNATSSTTVQETHQSTPEQPATTITTTTTTTTTTTEAPVENNVGHDASTTESTAEPVKVTSSSPAVPSEVITASPPSAPAITEDVASVAKAIEEIDISDKAVAAATIECNTNEIIAEARYQNNINE
ncbi:A-kinase anchor protein 200 [Apis florea]|uniref:A-kinase anchor protein 200 n=1 Tax=Apis florea TaxID=7463 RepID=UPI0012FF19E7|nr:A-kinase anchor protein 200 [Apis florea]